MLARTRHRLSIVVLCVCAFTVGTLYARPNLTQKFLHGIGRLNGRPISVWRGTPTWTLHLERKTDLLPFFHSLEVTPKEGRRLLEAGVPEGMVIGCY